jgi:hypothetical protein
LLEQQFPRIRFDRMEAGDSGFAAVHVWGGHVERLRGLRDVVLATTERDPEKVRRSWVNRGHKMETLDRCWREYAEILEMAPFVLSVDAPDRERRLREFGKVVGVDLETDWAPVNAWKG